MPISERSWPDNRRLSDMVLNDVPGLRADNEGEGEVR
jgi:hypothetical protein